MMSLTAHNLMADEIKHAKRYQTPFSWVDSQYVQVGTFGIYGQEDWLERLWVEAGYNMVAFDSAISGPAKVIDGIELRVFYIDGERLSHPVEPCTVHAFDPDSGDFLEVYEDFLNLDFAERAFPGLAARAALNL